MIQTNKAMMLLIILQYETLSSNILPGIGLLSSLISRLDFDPLLSTVLVALNILYGHYSVPW